jgi:hypothetical protein
MAILEILVRDTGNPVLLQGPPYFKDTRVVLVPVALTIDAPMTGLSARYAKGVQDIGTTQPLPSIPTRTRRYAQGVVKESGTPVCRRVCAFSRDPVRPIASGLSDQAGRFHLQWNDYAGKFFIIVFDDATDAVDYNCKVYDLLESVY